MREARFRRALSLAVDRNNINEFLYFGMAQPGNNTVLAESPLFKDSYRNRWAQYDPVLAGQLLDELGLNKTDSDGIRYMPDGRLLRLVLETTGEQSEQTDVLQLIEQNWRDIGIELLIKPSHRDTLRNRVAAGETHISVWGGLENGIPTAGATPEELLPHHRMNLQWPSWGLYEVSGGKSGTQADLPSVLRLLALNQTWLLAGDMEKRESI